MVAGFKGGSSWKGRSGRRLYQLSGMAFSSRRNFVCCISHLRYAALRDQTPAYSFSLHQVFMAQGTEARLRDCSTSRLQVFIQKGCYLRVGVESVLQFGQTVALVLVEQILDRTAVLFHPIDDLLGLPDGHAGIVLAVDNHERAVMSPALWMGLMDSSNSWSFSSEPYSGSRRLRR